MLVYLTDVAVISSPPHTLGVTVTQGLTVVTHSRLTTTPYRLVTHIPFHTLSTATATLYVTINRDILADTTNN